MPRRMSASWGSAGQLTRRTNPQMLQVAVPLRESISRKLGHPLVPQKSLELTAAAVDRRRIRRIAEARPVTDDVVERVIMVNVTCAFWCAVIAVCAIGCASLVSFRTYS